MRLLNTMMILGLALCLLPWGAYSGARAAALRTGLAAATAAEAVSSPPAGKARAIAARTPHETCRAATLPGAPCGPDLGLPAGATIALPQARLAPLRPDPGRPRGGIDPPGLLNPPRFL